MAEHLTIDGIYDMWNAECQIGIDLAEESRKTPILHSKYSQLLSTATLLKRRAENRLDSLLQTKYLYYNGKLDPKTIRQHGWNIDPFNGVKIMKGDLNYWYNADVDIQQAKDRVEYYKTMIDALKQICDALKWRHQTIRNTLEFMKFQAGG